MPVETLSCFHCGLSSRKHFSGALPGIGGVVQLARILQRDAGSRILHMLDLGSCTMQLEVGPMTHKKFVVHGSCVMVQVLHSLVEQCLWLVYPFCDAFCLAKSPMNNFSNWGLSFWGPLFLRLSNVLGATFNIKSLPLALSFLSTSTTTMH
jgi:hypothetical protein